MSAEVRVSRPATYQDVLDAPEHLTAEIVAGELHLQPRPAKPHTRAASVLGALLYDAFDLGRSGPGGWWILDEPELHQGGEILVPDLAGWLRSETPAFDDSVAYYEELPSWVCEVLSPSSTRHDRLRKMEAYHRHGVPWAWLVDPLAQTVEVYERAEAGWLRLQVGGEAETHALRPFDALELELALLWPSPTPESR